MRNKVIASIVACMMVASCFALTACGGGSAASSSGAQYKDGTYTGVGTGGRKGDVEVKVTVEGGKITKIEPGAHNETPNKFQPVVDQLIPAIIEKQSVEVDSISGSTMSSDAVKDGVKKALEQAK